MVLSKCKGHGFNYQGAHVLPFNAHLWKWLLILSYLFVGNINIHNFRCQYLFFGLIFSFTLSGLTFLCNRNTLLSVDPILMRSCVCVSGVRLVIWRRGSAAEQCLVWEAWTSLSAQLFQGNQMSQRYRSENPWFILIVHTVAMQDCKWA